MFSIPWLQSNIENTMWMSALLKSVVWPYQINCKGAPHTWKRNVILRRSTAVESLLLNINFVDNLQFFLIFQQNISRFSSLNYCNDFGIIILSLKVRSVDLAIGSILNGRSPDMISLKFRDLIILHRIVLFFFDFALLESQFFKMLLYLNNFGFFLQKLFLWSIPLILFFAFALFLVIFSSQTRRCPN